MDAAQRLRNSLTSHGVEVPVSFGQFGGWPGVRNRQLIVRGTDVRRLIALGELPLDLEDLLAPLDLERLGGELERLEAKVPEFELVPGDVVLYTWQGGGGYGDPLERDPALVERDLELGIISPQRGRSVYGVGGDRAALRRDRLEGAAAPHAPCGLLPGDPLTRIGLSLRLARGKSGLQIECECGQVLAAGRQNWKDGAATRRLEDRALPRGIVVHPTLELMQFLCTDCGRQHSVEVKERTEAPLHDIQLWTVQTPPDV